MSQTPPYTTSEDNFFIRIYHNTVDGPTEQVGHISKSYAGCRDLVSTILEILNK